MEKIVAPYGSWRSPITADIVAGSEKRLEGLSLYSDGSSRLVWLETRPSESGSVHSVLSSSFDFTN